MRTTIVVVAFLILAHANRARAESTCELVYTASEPPPMSDCLPDHAHVVVTGLVGLVPLAADGARGFSGFLRVDAPLGSHLWLEGRARYHGGGDIQVDGLVGIVLSHEYGYGRAWYATSVVDTGNIRTTTYTGDSTVVRKDLVLLGGLKVVNGPYMMSRTTVPMAALGIQKHIATGFGTHEVLEAFALYGDGKFGGVAAWHNSIPPTHGFVFGMEAGLLPGEKIGTIYWAMIELGYSFEG